MVCANLYLTAKTKELWVRVKWGMWNAEYCLVNIPHSSLDNISRQYIQHSAISGVFMQRRCCMLKTATQTKL